MKIVLEVSRAEVRAIARVLCAEREGEGYADGDGRKRDAVLARVVGLAAVSCGVVTGEIEEVVLREYGAMRQRANGD